MDRIFAMMLQINNFWVGKSLVKCILWISFLKQVENLLNKKYLPVVLLFFFFADNRSLSGLAAGSESVGAKYLRPEPLPILSDLGKDAVFFRSRMPSWVSLESCGLSRSTFSFSFFSSIL